MKSDSGAPLATPEETEPLKPNGQESGKVVIVQPSKNEPEDKLWTKIKVVSLPNKNIQNATIFDD